MSRVRRCSADTHTGMDDMFGKIIGAELGRRLAGRHNGIKGALIGAAAPWLLRRAFTPVGAAILGGIVAKKVYDSRKDRERARLADGRA